MMSSNHPTTYRDIMAKADEYTAGLRYFRTLPDECKDTRGTRILERYIMLLHAKARALFPAEMRRYLTEGE
jgi:hypothetical protein